MRFLIMVVREKPKEEKKVEKEKNLLNIKESQINVNQKNVNQKKQVVHVYQLSQFHKLNQNVIIQQLTT